MLVGAKTSNLKNDENAFTLATMFFIWRFASMISCFKCTANLVHSSDS